MTFRQDKRCTNATYIELKEQCQYNNNHIKRKRKKYLVYILVCIIYLMVIMKIGKKRLEPIMYG
jgi:presenilin-like A22 family membrane protease